MNVLIAAQVGCSLLLLVVDRRDGAHAAQPAVTSIPASTHRMPIVFTVDASAGVDHPSQSPAYFSRLYDRIAGMPAGRTDHARHIGLLTGGMTTGTIEVPGRPPASDDDRWVRLFFVARTSSKRSGMRIVAGQASGAGDDRRQRVAVVTEEFARFFFGSPQQAIGRLVNRDLLIVGVVADATYNTFRDAPARAMFLPFTQAPPRPTMTLIVRPAHSQRQAVEAVVPAIGRHDPRLKITVSTLVGHSRRRDGPRAIRGGDRRLAHVACAVFVLRGRVLDCRLRSFRTTERAGRTIGARRLVSRRLHAVISGPVRVALVGIVVGVPCAYALMRTISALLFGVAPFDVATILGSVVTLILITVAAAALPAWRASAIDPHECLKAQ